MPHVSFTRHLLRFFPHLSEGEVPGATVREVVDELDRRYPGFLAFVVDETGRLRRHVNVFVGDAPICDRETLADKVSPDDRVFILQALSGG
jgi:molybdopterin synthase sulfur carrier subunit